MFLNYFQGDRGPPGPVGPQGVKGEGYPGPQVCVYVYTYINCTLKRKRKKKELVQTGASGTCNSFPAASSEVHLKMSSR